MSAEKFEFNSSQHTEFTSMVQKWLNHKWKETYDVDLDPFDKATFPCRALMGEFILTSNDSLISINCEHQYCLQNSVPMQVNTVDCGLFTIKFIHNMLILGSLFWFTYTDWNDYFLKRITQSNRFCFDNDDIYCLKSAMKKLINTLILT